MSSFDRASPGPRSLSFVLPKYFISVTVVGLASYGTLYRVSAAIIGLYISHMDFDMEHDCALT